MYILSTNYEGIITKSSDYPKYDNYNAISVDKIKDIPKDYFKEMGVPISFIDKYNPLQFELIGIDRYLPNKKTKQRFVLNGKEKYARLLIKRKVINEN